MSEFDFDDWANLARRDPRAFFCARERLLKHFIDSHPPAQAARLWAFQQQIDCARGLAGSPLLATRQLMDLVESHLQALRLAVGVLDSATSRLARGTGPRGRPH